MRGTDEQRFSALAGLARELTGAYGEGYRYGLRRLHRGERFRNAAEKPSRVRPCQYDETSVDFVRGLLDGLAGRAPASTAT